MEQVDKEAQLISNLHKCRCCFRMIIDDRKAVQIDETIKNNFFCLTQVELLLSDIFANRICQLCNNDLMTFFELRKDLISKQNALYELAGLDIIDSNTDTLEEQIDEDYEMIETSSTKDENYSNTQVVLEEEAEEQNFDYEDSEIVYEEDEDDNKESLTKPVLKIERIERDNVESQKEEENEYLIGYFTESNEDSSTNNQSSDETLETEMCEICDLEVFKSCLPQHIDLMHVEENCSKCNEKFQSKIQLKRHIIENHSANLKNRKNKKKSNYCPLCFKEYDYKKQLIDHIRSFHIKERNTECPVCKKRFYHRDLKKHIFHVHGEKKIACEVCGKMYTCLENLRLHSKYHSEPKYTCDYENCGKKFHQKSLWEHHLLKHKNEKNIICNECKSSFYTLRDLKRHNQRVHNKVSRKCFQCDNSFCRKDKYREHVLKHHRDLPEETKAKILEEIKNMKWHE